MEKKIEFAVAAITTNKVFPKVFSTKEEAETNRLKHADPSHWKIVKREVIYGKWE